MPISSNGATTASAGELEDYRLLLDRFDRENFGITAIFAGHGDGAFVDQQKWLKATACMVQKRIAPAVSLVQRLATLTALRKS